MKHRTQLLIVALASAGLILSGCDILFPDEDPVEEEDEVEEIEEPVALEEEEEEEEEEVEELDIDEDMFILAAFESACVSQEVEDDEEAAEIKEEIYARYGLTDETFEQAEEEFGDEENVELAVETRMERCDEEMARGFAEEGAGELEEEDEEAEEAEEEAEEETAEQAQRAEPPPRPPQTGTLTGDISGADFEDTTLTLRVRSDFNVSGELRGSREGRNFMVPLSGEVSEAGSLSVSGDRGGNTVEVQGSLSEDGAEGVISGDVHQRGYRVRYSAN